MLIPAVDLATNVWPFRFGEPGWRYGTTGLLSGFLLTPILGLVLGMAVARLISHRRTLRTLGWLSGLGALLLVALTVLFALDVLQVRVQVPAEGDTAFLVGAVRAVVKITLVAVALSWLCVGALRGSGRLQASRDGG